MTRPANLVRRNSHEATDSRIVGIAVVVPTRRRFSSGLGHRVYRDAPGTEFRRPNASQTHRDCVSQGPDPVFKPLCLHHHHLAVVGAERNSRHTLKGGEQMDREFS